MASMRAGSGSMAGGGMARRRAWRLEILSRRGDAWRRVGARRVRRAAGGWRRALPSIARTCAVWRVNGQAAANAQAARQTRQRATAAIVWRRRR